MKERNISLDAMKGFAILLVMIGHVLNLNKISDPYLYRVIETIQMPLFIMLNGYISGFQLPIDRFEQWKSTMSKRGIAYLVPFFTWLLLKQWDDLARGFKDTLFQLDRGLWFLMTLFVLNVILYTAQLLSKNFRKKGKVLGFFAFGIIFGMISVIFVLQFIFHNTFLSPELTIRYIPPFLVGYLMSTYKEDIVKIFNKKLQFLAFIICLSVFVFVCVKYEYYRPTKFILPIQIVEGLIGSYLVFYTFLKSKKNVIKYKLAWLGQYTLEIYTIHFHFANKISPDELDFGLYSLQGITFAIATFVFMSITTAGLIYMAKQVPFTNFLLFGKQWRKSRN
jgi:fucose 4-O-acetylase-like acetyltransferase